MLLPSAIQFKDKDPIEHPCQLCLVRPICIKNFLTCDILREYITLVLCVKQIQDSKKEDEQHSLLHKLVEGALMIYDLDVNLNFRTLECNEQRLK